MQEFDGSYVVRWGWTRRAVLVVALLTPVIALGFTPFAAELDHIELVLVPIPLSIVAICSSRRKVFELDRYGVTFFRFGKRFEFVPWSEVMAVEWGPRLGTDILTVCRRPRTAAALPPLDPTGSPIDGYLVDTVGQGFLDDFQGVRRLQAATGLTDFDPDLLTASLVMHAPKVQFFGTLAHLWPDWPQDDPTGDGDGPAPGLSGT
ncbi:hypothetical protein ACFYST_31745 [Kitasatospora sp. NPDC004614]|uniref:hypothetical protein n=1 Tax=unclassified Kitasatospora TaxID=2633591 RepID=UPI00368D9F5C